MPAHLPDNLKFDQKLCQKPVSYTHLDVYKRQAQSLAKKVYETELATWQGRLSELMRHPDFRKRALILAFEGSDAAGKGGAIRRITSAMDARQYQICLLYTSRCV